jgi:hypothetical protein
MRCQGSRHGAVDGAVRTLLRGGGVHGCLPRTRVSSRFPKSKRGLSVCSVRAATISACCCRRILPLGIRGRVAVRWHRDRRQSRIDRHRLRVGWQRWQADRQAAGVAGRRLVRMPAVLGLFSGRGSGSSVASAWVCFGALLCSSLQRTPWRWRTTRRGLGTSFAWCQVVAGCRVVAR